MRRLISLIIGVLALAFTKDAAAQWSTTGNSNTVPGTNYIGTRDWSDFVFKTYNIERGRIITADGSWRFGSSTSYAKVDAVGRLSFAGAGVYQVGANKYVYQFSGAPNTGLFYNQTAAAHEFRDYYSAVVASIGAVSGNGYFKGNVGIGNTAPAYRLDVTGTGRFTGTLKVGAYTLPATDGASGQVLATNGAGTVVWTTAGSGGGFNPWIISGSTIYYGNGDVGIGTSDLAFGYKLSVKGKIMCEEVKVQPSSSWPDYVFENGYSLMPLEELATKVEADKHLPGIPSANEIKEKGLGIGEMQTKMMEKVEELTLYLIDANKQMNAANENIRALQQENEQLQQRMKEMEAKGN